MNGSLKSEKFELVYTEGESRAALLWENHCHAQFEMIAVLEGEVSVMLEGEEYHLQKHHTIIVPPLCYHSITVRESGVYRRVTALFDADLIPKVIRERFLKGVGAAPLSFLPISEQLKELILEGKPQFFAPLAESLMVQIFYDAVQSEGKHVGAVADDFLQKTIFYIDGHLHEKIRLEELARLTSRSKSSFCHLFEEKMKISPKQYILQKKLALAAGLIDEGTPPTVAATQIGYENYSNFYRLYVKQFGTNPTRKKTQRLASRPLDTKGKIC